MPADFAGLLREQIGLDVESVGAELIARAVEERRLSCQLGDDAVYWERVTGSPVELQALIEAVIVPETWFFRDREAFATLATAVSERCRSHPSAPLRLLSLPCATGEEAYSMAMALLDAGVDEHRFSIDAMDISERVLERARRATYGNNAFRGTELGYRDRHFERVGSGYRLLERVQRAVSFRHGNLLSADQVLSPGSYDAIFCRNVLIYLDPQAQRRALDVLARLAKDEGLLFVGPSETSACDGETFVSTRIPLAFAFRKTPRDARAIKAPPRALPRSPAAKAPPRLAPPAPVVRATPKAPSQARPSGPEALDPQAHLRRVAELADRGELVEAARRCAEHLRLHGPSAGLFHLMGLLRETANELEEAAALYKKALYLEPAHETSLVHLALLLEKLGDAAGAERLRRRARRLEPGGGQ